MAAGGSFATSISCIDGRIQLPLSEWIRRRAGVDYVDTITEPGLDRRLSGSAEAAEALRKKAVISAKAHGSRFIAVSGHAECAGNPVSEAEHLEHIAAAADVVRSWGLGAEVAGAWVGPDWKVREV